MNNTRLKRQFNNYRWDDVSKIEYKSGGKDTFFNVDRQNIISSADGVDFDVRYFECGAGGFTTLEKHAHVHIVMIARGCGRVIIGENVFEAQPNDFFIIPSWTPHQLINAGDTPFGFFCSVNATRDKFVLLSEEEARSLKENKDVDEWVKIPSTYFDNAVQ